MVRKETSANILIVWLTYCEDKGFFRWSNSRLSIYYNFHYEKHLVTLRHSLIDSFNRLTNINWNLFVPDTIVDAEDKKIKKTKWLPQKAHI